MATNDVPGANPANADVLAAGCWAEHQDGSLCYVKGTENRQVVYELYDLAQDQPVYYQDAMREDAFKTAFSWKPVGASKEKWTWHDKSPFPWSRVIRTFDKPRPVMADVHDQLSAAARVARSLRLRAQKLQPEDVEKSTERAAKRVEATAEQAERVVPRGGKGIVQRIQEAVAVLFGE